MKNLKHYVAVALISAIVGSGIAVMSKAVEDRRAAATASEEVRRSMGMDLPPPSSPVAAASGARP
jgi:hypothetical protein